MRLLTLALPIYNGESCVSHTLESIYLAQQLLPEVQYKKFEIIISDNNSNDNTAEIINEFKHKLDITYYKNEQNIGYDRNIDLLVEKSNSKYVWFLGCGEKLINDALVRLIEKLDNDIEYTNILLDFEIFNESENKITDKNIFQFSSDISINLKDDFSYAKYGLAVSSNIVNRKKWQEVCHNPFVVDGWCHIERILDMIALNENAKTLLLVNPYFTLYREKYGWWTKSDSYMLLLLHIDVIRSMHQKGYHKDSIKKLELKQSRAALLMAIVQSKEYGLKISGQLLEEIFQRFKFDYFFWFIALPVILIPNKLIFVLKYIFNFLQKIKSIIA